MNKRLLTEPQVVEKVAWFNFEDQHVLFAYSHDEEFAYTVGGKIKPGETHHDALVREVKEETDVHLLRNTIRFYEYFEGPCDGYPPGSVLKMWTYFAGFRGTLQPSGEIRKFIRLGPEHIGKKYTTPMGDDILRHLTHHRLIGHP